MQKDEQELFDELAGKYEHDAGMNWARAESRALKEIAELKANTTQEAIA